MSTFVKGNLNGGTPFGRNEFLRSTKILLTESYTCAAATVPAQTIDGATGQKILQPGTVMAKITSTADSGKVGPFSAAATDGRQTLANVVGLNLTFLPWQLIERDVEISAVYSCTAVQGWCIEYNASNLPIVLTNTTAAGLTAQKSMNVLFK
jgi:hypothetical protein